jgi:hypothetical protein
VGKDMRSWLSVQLGTWHSYKQANAVMWKYGLERWFGPLFNFLIPDANVRKQPKLLTLVTFFSYVRLAYPQFKDQLLKAIADLGESDKPRDQVGHSNLKDLQFIIDFALPVVRLCSCTLVSQHPPSFLLHIILLCFYNIIKTKQKN